MSNFPVGNFEAQIELKNEEATEIGSCKQSWDVMRGNNCGEWLVYFLTFLSIPISRVFWKKKVWRCYESFVIKVKKNIARALGFPYWVPSIFSSVNVFLRWTACLKMMNLDRISPTISHIALVLRVLEANKTAIKSTSSRKMRKELVNSRKIKVRKDLGVRYCTPIGFYSCNLHRWVPWKWIIGSLSPHGCLKK